MEFCFVEEEKSIFNMWKLQRFYLENMMDSELLFYF